MPLKFKQTLYQTRSLIDCVYFPDQGSISAHTIKTNGSAIEAATIGNDSAMGLMAFIGAKTSPNE